MNKAYRTLESLRIPDWTSLIVAGNSLPIVADPIDIPVKKPRHITDKCFRGCLMTLVSDSDQDLVSHDSVHILDDDIYNTAYLSEAQATSLHSLLSHLQSTGTFNRPSLVIDYGASISITNDTSDFISPFPHQLSFAH